MTITRIALALLIAAPVLADPLTDVRTALARFNGRDAIRVAYELQQSVSNEGKFGNDKFNGKVSIDIAADANGYQLIVPQSLREQIEQEQTARDRNPKLSTPTANALSEIDTVEAAEIIDLAPRLTRLIEGAKVVSDVAGTWAGKPARVVILRAQDRIDPDDASKMKIAENKVTLWLDSENVPLAVEHMFAGKFSFLFLKGETRQKKSWHLARAGNRLIRARYELTTTSSGMGQKGLETVVATAHVR